MHVEEIAREQVAAEQEIVRLAVEAAVAERVAGQMHDPQPAPERQLVAVGDRHVDDGGRPTRSTARPARSSRPHQTFAPAYG